MRFVFLLLALAAFGSSARAEELVKASDTDTIVDLARGFGSATIEKGDTTYIKGRIDGTVYAIFFYDCDAEGADCKSIQFYASWDDAVVKPDAISAWNRDKRFAKAYMDNEDDPVLEMDVNMRHGVARANLEDTIDWWRISLEKFKSDVLEL
ncbi:YbjN domain-containing protein [Aurantimonas aggregata]|uniref:YbjN domain-containing protein n=1 Tax=Aurantimonas aggregata TaxID=2047720 RepID=A0A6L9MIK5_9HYPH|nr:YbjN domain-containing protein [Aurantimonas aggregata]NDV87290.1 YbjN domain-containing protein [Aurantimonas aggregata]